MNVLHPQTPTDRSDYAESHRETPVAKMTTDILPACFLLGIIAGFSAFVAFGQAVLPAMVAAVLGALLGLFLACDDHPTQKPHQQSHRQSHRQPPNSRHHRE